MHGNNNTKSGRKEIEVHFYEFLMSSEYGHLQHQCEQQ
jgi:hypothetical protein